MIVLPEVALAKLFYLSDSREQKQKSQKAPVSALCAEI